MVAHYAAIIRVASEDRGGSLTELDPFLQSTFQVRTFPAADRTVS